MGRVGDPGKEKGRSHLPMPTVATAAGILFRVSIVREDFDADESCAAGENKSEQLKKLRTVSFPTYSPCVNEEDMPGAHPRLWRMVGLPSGTWWALVLFGRLRIPSEWVFSRGCCATRLIPMGSTGLSYSGLLSNVRRLRPNNGTRLRGLYTGQNQSRPGCPCLMD